ncbi:MAG: PAS domain S-box protein [Ignavibacteria bacterium]
MSTKTTSKSKEYKSIFNNIENEGGNILPQVVNQYFYDVFDKSSFLVCHLNTEGNFTFFSKSLIALIGYTIEDIPDVETWFNTLYPDEKYRKEVLELWPKDLTGKSLAGCKKVFKVTCKNGEVQTMKFEFVCNNDGSQFLFLEDLTEINKAHEEIKKNEERFRSFYENANIGIYRSTPGGKLLMANPRLIEMLGYDSFQEISSHNIKAIGYANSEDRNKFIDAIAREGRVSGFKTTWKKSDGSKLFIRENAIAVKDDTGKVIFYEGAIEDISDQRRSEEIQNVLFAISQAVNTSESLKGFLAEVRTLLSPLLNTENFYVALYNKESDTYTFPYHVDKFDKVDDISQVDLKYSLTDYVRRKNEALLIDADKERELAEIGEVKKIVGEYSPIWLGVPLRFQNKVIGVFVVQSYGSRYDYSYEDLEVLKIVSENISSAINRKLAEEKLAQSELKYRNFVTQSTEGIWYVEFENSVDINLPLEKQIYLITEGVLTECNDAFAKMYEFSTRLDIIGKKVSEFYGGQTDNYDTNCKFIKNGYKIINGETIEYNEKGEKIIFQNNAVGIINNNLLAGIWGTQRDITELKTAQETIIESENKYRLLFESASDAIFIMSNNVFIDCNDKTLEIFGCEREEILGHTPDEFSPEFQADGKKSSQKASEKINAALHGKPQKFEWHHSKKSGEVFDAEVSLNAVELISGIHIQAIVRDITDRKKTENALKESEERYKSLFENSQLGIYQATLDGRFLICNPAFLKILGHNSVKELRNVNIYEDLYINKTDRDNFVEILKQNKIITGFETIIRNSLKKIIYIKEYARLIRLENGGYIIEGVVQDITEKKLGEQAIIDAKEKAVQSDKLKTEFLAQMSHEIRTPVNAILSFTGLLKNELETSVPEDLTDSFEIIDRAGKRIIRTIDLLLDMSQMQAGTYESKFKKFDIREDILVNIFHEYKQIAKEKNIDFEIEVYTKDNMIFADEYTVGQIFNNLVDNALKYTEKGSIKIILKEEDNNLNVSVKDSGIGIAEEFLPNLFKPFTQEEQGYTRKYEGNGLGLALVKRYCEINRAEISVKSSKERGSEFIVSFPR